MPHPSREKNPIFILLISSVRLTVPVRRRAARLPSFPRRRSGMKAPRTQSFCRKENQSHGLAGHQEPAGYPELLPAVFLLVHPGAASRPLDGEKLHPACTITNSTVSQTLFRRGKQSPPPRTLEHEGGATLRERAAVTPTHGHAGPAHALGSRFPAGAQTEGHR